MTPNVKELAKKYGKAFILWGKPKTELEHYYHALRKQYQTLSLDMVDYEIMDEDDTKIRAELNTLREVLVDLGTIIHKEK